ncbi:MAG: methylenetetrahydrofolate--tRNA-(uracil(54)-C(5))-methyltransferase (FADH(2)-oxidizing) TrmFO [Oscillospiraceae bacterium]
MPNRVSVVGAGLAGCEAAWTLAQRGIPVSLYEMKPKRFSPAHRSENFAELVCSNSLKAMRTASAAGLLKAEMRLLDSLLLDCADKAQVAAGGALAVDRDDFSALVTQRIQSHPLITTVREETVTIPEGDVIIATGPLTSDALAAEIAELCGTASLSFYDAAAPIVTADSVDMDKAFFAARYGRGEDDYINCPFSQKEYERFYEALVEAEAVPLKEFEENGRVYEGCMPVEVMAKRGKDTLRFGPLRPVGLRDPRTGHRPWAVVQLRRENTAGSLYNLVGFQTNLRFPEQKRVFSLIPGLENVEFARYGVMHRNTFLDSPRLLDADFSLRRDRRIYFAGQITGVEGYMESAASGLIAAHNLARKLSGKEPLTLPEDTMLGALSAYVGNPEVEDFQPMGANMGILPPLPIRVKGKQERYQMVADRALDSLQQALAVQKF